MLTGHNDNFKMPLTLNDTTNGYFLCMLKWCLRSCYKGKRIWHGKVRARDVQGERNPSGVFQLKTTLLS